ncbi:MAG: hypothetical protein GY699_02600 [Desulfobacteraceae bacterium]|nr:hypothetical protein [Desulfobacteraceae bacterium]
MRLSTRLDDIIDEHDVDFNSRPMSFDGGISINDISKVTSYSLRFRYAVDTTLESGDITFFRNGDSVGLRIAADCGGSPIDEVRL